MALHRDHGLRYFQYFSIPGHDFRVGTKTEILAYPGSLALKQLIINPMHCVVCQQHIGDKIYACLGCKTIRCCSIACFKDIYDKPEHKLYCWVCVQYRFLMGIEKPQERVIRARTLASASLKCPCSRCEITLPENCDRCVAEKYVHLRSLEDRLAAKTLVELKYGPPRRIQVQDEALDLSNKRSREGSNFADHHQKRQKIELICSNLAERKQASVEPLVCM